MLFVEGKNEEIEEFVRKEDYPSGFCYVDEEVLKETLNKKEEKE